MLFSDEALISLLLSEFILEDFDLKSAQNEENVLHIDLEEVNLVPSVRKSRIERRDGF